MANSFDVNPSGGWDILSVPNTTGTVGVKGSGLVLFSEQNADPAVDSEVGLLMNENHPPLGYSMNPGQSLYARRISGNCTISVTVT